MDQRRPDCEQERAARTSSNPRIPFELSSHRKRLEPPGGKPLLVNVVVNIEYWPFDRPMPRGILPAPHGAQVAQAEEIRRCLTRFEALTGRRARALCGRLNS